MNTFPTYQYCINVLYAQTSRDLELGCSSVVEWLAYPASAYQNYKEKQSQTVILSVFWETGVQKGSADNPPQENLFSLLLMNSN